jgi:hypothetical protein
LIPRAISRLESVQGILGIKSELFVAAPEKPNDLLLFSPPAEEPLRTESASPDPLSGAFSALTGRTLKASPATADTPAAGSTRPVESPPTDGTPTISPPVRVPAVPAPGIPSPAPGNVEALAIVVDRLRSSDPRFRSLRIDLKGGMVIVAGTADRDEDLMAFARAAALLPGVSRVVTKNDDPSR